MRRVLGILASAVLVMLVLTGCPSRIAKEGVSRYFSPSELASRIGCTGFEQQDAAQSAREEGRCTLGSDSLTIATFSYAGDRDNWLKVAQGSAGIYVVGLGWVVVAHSEVSARRVRARLGGEIQ